MEQISSTRVDVLETALLAVGNTISLEAIKIQEAISEGRLDIAMISRHETYNA